MTPANARTDALPSLTRRLVITVLLIELVLAMLVTAAALLYQRDEHIRAFDVMLHGRAASILGSVRDADNETDDIALDQNSLNVPSRDLYLVREESGKILGGSQQRADQALLQIPDDDEEHDFRTDGKSYRGYVLHGSRTVDAEDHGGVLHRVAIYYAAPLRPVWHAVWRAAKYFFLADVLALLLSVAAVARLIRRSLRPLDALAAQAAAISPHQWGFQAPPSAYATRELAPLASALDTALKGLEQAFKQQRNFVNDAAHELKTAVTVLKSSLQLLTFRERSNEEYRQGIEVCIADTGRMEDLVQHMLTLARLEQPEAADIAELGSADLRDVVLEVLEQVTPAASMGQLVLKHEFSGATSAAVSYDNVITLVTNLVMNAIQHSPDGKSVTVSVHGSDQQVRLEVADEGEGIAAEHLPFIFERFYRADASRSRDTGGTGLGLAICKAIVDGCGGTIDVSSRLGEGTTVRVVLPATQPALMPASQLQRQLVR